MILFLCEDFKQEDLTRKVFEDSQFPNIDKRMIHFEKYEDGEGFDEDKIKKILYKLERFCSYHNELGDRFSIGKGENLVDYDLTELNFPFTINICCIGRFGKGKSTGANLILGEKKAIENRSGTAATKKIIFYQVSNFPIKIYDLPGFENKETVKNAVEKFKVLNEEIHKLQDQIHLILYFIKSTDERMFSEMEYDIFKQIILHKDAFVIYVLTHSSTKTDREEIYDMINTGIKGVIERKKEKLNDPSLFEEEFQNIYLKMVASSDNCCFVNFHKTNKLPIYGLSHFFDKMADFVEMTDAYHHFTKSKYISDEDFHNKIVQEAKIRKIRANDVLLRHKIGGAVAGLLPGADILVRNFVIKKDAARKAGEIFGFDIKTINDAIKKQEKSKKNKEKKNISNNETMESSGTEINENELASPKLDTFEPNKNNDNLGTNSNEKSNLVDEDSKNNDNNKEIDEIKKKQKDGDKKIKYGGFAASAVTGAVSWSTGAARFFAAAGGIGLMAVSITFSFIGSAIGAGLGGFLMYRHCQELLDQFERLFIENADNLSDSLVVGVNYLRNLSKYYKTFSQNETKENQDKK